MLATTRTLSVFVSQFGFSSLRPLNLRVCVFRWRMTTEASELRRSASALIIEHTHT